MHVIRRGIFVLLPLGVVMGCGTGVHQVMSVLLLLLVPVAVVFALNMKLDKQLNEDGEKSEIDAAAAAKVQA